MSSPIHIPDPCPSHPQLTLSSRSLGAPLCCLPTDEEVEAQLHRHTQGKRVRGGSSQCSTENARLSSVPSPSTTTTTVEAEHSGPAFLPRLVPDVSLDKP